MTVVVIALMVVVVAIVQIAEYRRSPFCCWCRSRHYGRCVFNPRSGRVLANVNDGHFRYDDANE